MSRLLFAFPDGIAHELWDTSANVSWAQSIGACVAAHLRYHPAGEPPKPAPVALSASMVEAMDETMGGGAMSYTLEQKREALHCNELWWRLPNELGAGDRKWSLCFYHGCISSSEAEYHIGPTAPTPPRVLSELEGGLLEALKEIDSRLSISAEIGLTAEEAYDSFYQDVVRSAIQEAEGTA
jgi:hypothetical protein